MSTDSEKLMDYQKRFRFNVGLFFTMAAVKDLTLDQCLPTLPDRPRFCSLPTELPGIECSARFVFVVLRESLNVDSLEVPKD